MLPSGRVSSTTTYCQASASPRKQQRVAQDTDVNWNTSHEVAAEYYASDGEEIVDQAYTWVLKDLPEKPRRRTTSVSQVTACLLSQAFTFQPLG